MMLHGLEFRRPAASSRRGPRTGCPERIAEFKRLNSDFYENDGNFASCPYEQGGRLGT